MKQISRSVEGPFQGFSVSIVVQTGGTICYWYLASGKCGNNFEVLIQGLVLFVNRTPGEESKTIGQ